MDSLDDVLQNQPIYQADLIFTGLPSGEVRAGRVATNGAALRLDTGLGTRAGAADTGPDVTPLQMSMLIRPGHTTRMLLPEFQGYTEFSAGFEPARTILLPSLGMIFRAFWLDDALAECPEREVVGQKFVDGHPCLKIK